MHEDPYQMLQYEASDLCLFSCFMSTVNSLGHVGMVSYPNHTFPGQAQPKQLTSTKCSSFCH